jgi:rhomboid protease GluP
MTQRLLAHRDPKGPRVVPILVIANLCVFLVHLTAPQLTTALALVPTHFFARPWTFLTYMFLHDGLPHLAFNMLGLYVIGAPAERLMGRGSFIMLYLISGSSGALLATAFSDRIALVGASAGVFGLMAPFARSTTSMNVGRAFSLPARFLIVLLAAWSIWSSIGAPGGNTALLAHLGGFVGGYVYHTWWEHLRRP